MNARGERILIFGDSLTHHGGTNDPEAWNVNIGSDRATSAPGDLLASLLAEQGAAAVRTDARIGRSAYNFFAREDAQGLLAADLAWKPTKVIIMLGTNDAATGVGIEADAAKMVMLRDAFANAGAEVWAIGPFDSSVDKTRVAQIIAMMKTVFGYRFIDGRTLDEFATHAGDGVHYTPGGARTLGLALAKALLGKPSPKSIWTGLVLGAFGVIGGIAAWKIYQNVRHHQPLLAGPELDEDEPQEGEDNDRWWERIQRNAKAKRQHIADALEAHDALVLDSHGRKILLVKTAEMSNPDEGSIRITEFDEDGPIGHATGATIDELAKRISGDWNPSALTPISEAEVIAWTGTDRFAEGAERVAAVQRANAGLKGADDLTPAMQRHLKGDDDVRLIKQGEGYVVDYAGQRYEVFRGYDKKWKVTTEEHGLIGEAKTLKEIRDAIARGPIEHDPTFQWNTSRETPEVRMTVLDHYDLDDRGAVIRKPLKGLKGLVGIIDIVNGKRFDGDPARKGFIRVPCASDIDKRGLARCWGRKPLGELGNPEQRYRVAYALVTRRDGGVTTVREIVDAPRALTLAEAEKWRRQWGKGHTAWIETMDGEFVPVKGAKRNPGITTNKRPGEVHATLTADYAKPKLEGLMGETKTVDVRKLFAWGPKVQDTIVDVEEGRVSRSNGQPISASRLDSPRGAFWILDGHHRAVEAARRGDKTVRIEISDHVPRIERTGGAYASVLGQRVNIAQRTAGLGDVTPAQRKLTKKFLIDARKILTELEAGTAKTEAELHALRERAERAATSLHRKRDAVIESPVFETDDEDALELRDQLEEVSVPYKDGILATLDVLDEDWRRELTQRLQALDEIEP